MAQHRVSTRRRHRESDVVVLVLYVIRLNLRPGKRSLVAKVEDEAGVHDVMTLDPRNAFTYKIQFFCVR